MAAAESYSLEGEKLYLPEENAPLTKAESTLLGRLQETVAQLKTDDPNSRLDE